MFVVKSQNDNIVAEVISVRTINKKNIQTKEVEEISLVGTMVTGKDITLARYTPDQAKVAKAMINKLFKVANATSGCIAVNMNEGKE